MHARHFFFCSAVSVLEGKEDCKLGREVVKNIITPIAYPKEGATPLSFCIDHVMPPMRESIEEKTFSGQTNSIKLDTLTNKLQTIRHTMAKEVLTI